MVAAKSRPLMSLIARALSTTSSSASESLEKGSFGNQSPWRAKAEKFNRTGQLGVDRDVCSARNPTETMIKLGLLKSGKLISRWKIEQGHPVSILGQGRTSSNQVSLMRRPSTLFWKKKFMIERGHRLSALKEEQGHSNSSLETTKQKWNSR